MAKVTPLFQRPLPRSYFYGTLGIIALNLLVYLVNEISFETRGLLAMNPIDVVTGGAWWQVFTYMYVHSDLNHILFN
ncbi:MAG TPA: rhomboid family intramembrane serine protease, partial [Spirochaetia bacterium]|nr:rhomboid family intramembrane serine protease [Spirochaetia bacterium]